MKYPSDGKETDAHGGKTPARNFIIPKNAQGDQRNPHHDHNESGPRKNRVFVHSHFSITFLFKLVLSLLKWFTISLIGYKMMFLHWLCGSKKPSSETKTPVFRFNRKSLNHSLH